MENSFIKKELPQGEILKIQEIPGHNIYNCSRPFKINDQIFIFARIENLKTYSSHISLFRLRNNTLEKVNWQINQNDLELEDPFLTFINDQIIFGAVQVLDRISSNEWIVKTIFYKGKDIFSLEKFAEGPLMMKDIRLIDLKNGNIGVFTRPKGGNFFNGRICYIEIDDLKKLNFEETYKQAKLINLPISSNEWVGANDIYYLEDRSKSKLGVLGHLANFNENNLYYSAITFVFNPDDFSVTNFKIIAERKNFPNGKAKNEMTRDVVFPGGLLWDDGVYLYCGLSDAEIGKIKIKDPFQ